MSTMIIKQADGQYALDNNGVITPITKIVDGGKTLKLPANDSNRQYFSIANFEKAQKDGELELTYKPSVSITRTEGTAPRTIKPLEDWLSPEDKAIFVELKAKAQKARDEANTVSNLTSEEKAKRRLERAQAAYAALLANPNAPETEVEEASAEATEAQEEVKSTKKSKK